MVEAEYTELEPRTTPYFVDSSVTLHSGDCIVLLTADELGYDWSLGYGTKRMFPDASIDAVVTDPPYGLEFMGRDWDKPWQRGDDINADAAFTKVVMADGKQRLPRPSFTGSTNPKCLNCKGTPRGRRDGAAVVKVCTCDRPSFPNMRAAEMQAYQLWCQRWAPELFRVLKPGGHLITFGGTRTWHRLAVAIEDTGFEIRDTLAWLHGQGFPKSVNVSRAIDKAAGVEPVVISTGSSVKRMIPGADQNRTGSWIKADGREYTPILTASATPEAAQWEGWGTGLKPAFEPIILARKPLQGTIVTNVLKHGTGALNIDGCRVTSRETAPPGELSHHTDAQTTQTHDHKRWPPNVALDTALAAELDRQSGALKSGANPTQRHSDKFGHTYGDFTGQAQCVAHRGADEGGASRFFPVFRYSAKASADERPCVNGIQHPTVKPLALARWLVRLVTPPHGVVLDPFAGSGTTAEACIHEHKRCIAIEGESDYLPLIVQRLRKPIEVGFDFGETS